MEEQSVVKPLSFNALKDIPNTILNQIIQGSLQEVIQKLFDNIPDKSKLFSEALWNSSKLVPQDVASKVYTKEAEAVFIEILKQLLGQIPQNISQQASQQVIQQIVQQVGPNLHAVEMIPYLQSQMLKKPKDSGRTLTEKDANGIEWVNAPESGGVYTKLSGFREPFRGFPPIEFVFTLDGVKKIIKALLQSLQSISKWKLVIMAPLVYSSIRGIFNKTLYGLYAALRNYELKPDKYSQPVREVLRCFEQAKIDESKETRLMLDRLGMVICLLLEFDNAYRFRFQDVFSEFNHYYEKGIVNEIMRMFDLMIEREVATVKKNEWKLFKRIVGLCLKFNKEARRLAEKVLEFNTDEVMLSKEDICFCEGRQDYTFGFMKKNGYISGANLDYLLQASMKNIPQIKEIQANVGAIKKWSETLRLVPEEALKEDFRKS